MVRALTNNIKDDAGNKQFKQVLNAGEKAFKQLYEIGSYQPEDLASQKAYKSLIQSTAKVFEKAVTDNQIPTAMANALNNDVFIFSGLKTHAQLYEASRLLRDDQGIIKSYNQFAKDFNQINKQYNQTYLAAEHQYALGAAQSAANWANFSDDTDRYNLQYRTAMDDRVRAEHAALQDTTLPKDDPFWDYYMPPLGWNCRCVAVEVRSAKYESGDSNDAIAKGEKATTQIGKDGTNRLEIFRFNPGKQKVIFPPKHPYYPQHCNGGKLNMSGMIGYSSIVLSAENDKCRAKKVITEISKTAVAKKRNT